MIFERVKLNETAYLDLYIIDDVRKKPFVLVMPGGAYVFTQPREGEPVALAFNSQGMSAGVLWYTTKDKVTKTYKNATEEAALALKHVVDRSEAYNIDQYGVCGFSAGGNLALQIATHYKDAWIKDLVGDIAVDFVVASYPMISRDIFELLGPRAYNHLENPNSVNMRILGTQNPTEADFYEYDVLNHITKDTPPMFIWHTYEDELVKVEDALDLARSLNSVKVPFELHIFETGVHGMALANDVTAQGDDHLINKQAQHWFELCIYWIRNMRGK